MTPASCLTLTSDLHRQVFSHLFPGDGLEAAAILLCARTPGPRIRLLARSAVLVPHDQCVRKRDQLSWPGLAIEEAIDMAEAEHLSLMLVHSHPGGLFAFSTADDSSDLITIPSILHAHRGPHGSAIMLPDGSMLARAYLDGKLNPTVLDVVSTTGHDIRLCWSDAAFRARPMAFSTESREEFGRLTVCVIGASGTGSIVAEQLARLGVGRIYLIDFDRVEHKNLNRILNSTLADAEASELKVHALARAISLYRGPGVAIPIPTSIFQRDAVLHASQADVLFSCVDSHEGRKIADLIAATFLQPLFDVGVVIPTRTLDDGIAISDVCGRVDYVRPGGPTLADRMVYSDASLRAENLLENDPSTHAREAAEGYIPGADEEAPSVITLNMRAASDLVMEFQARIHPFRHDPNENFSRREFALASAEEEFQHESAFNITQNPLLARGDIEPLLGLPILNTVKTAPVTSCSNEAYRD